MLQIDYDIDDFLTYCEVKNLSIKTIASYEQTLKRKKYKTGKNNH